MAIYQLKTFADIIASAMEELKLQSGDVVSKNRIKRNINTVYQEEVAPAAHWKWLTKSLNVTVDPYLSTGTVDVTEGSRLVSLTDAPAFNRKGFLFSINGQREVYRIADHDFGTGVTLEVPYTGETATGLSYKIWSDRVVLPADCQGLSSVTSPYQEDPLTEVGPIEFERYVAQNPKLEGRPAIISLGDKVDPDPYEAVEDLPDPAESQSSGLVKQITFSDSVAALLSVGDRIEVRDSDLTTMDGEFIISAVDGVTITYTGLEYLEDTDGSDTGTSVRRLRSETSANAYRELLIYPSLNSARSSVSVKYLREVPPLENDSDEPLIPVEDRVVLLYGTLSRDWVRERIPDEGARNMALYQSKLSKMASRVQTSSDNPEFIPDRGYLAAKRGIRRPRRRWESD
jgi:hypothetical protein